MSLSHDLSKPAPSSNLRQKAASGGSKSAEHPGTLPVLTSSVSVPSQSITGAISNKFLITSYPQPVPGVLATSTAVDTARGDAPKIGSEMPPVSKIHHIKLNRTSSDGGRYELLWPFLGTGPFSTQRGHSISRDIPEFIPTPLFPDPSKVPAGLPDNYAEDEIAKIVEKMRKKTEKHMLKHLKVASSRDHPREALPPAGTKAIKSGLKGVINHAQATCETIKQSPSTAEVVSRPGPRKTQGGNSFSKRSNLSFPCNRPDKNTDCAAASLAKRIALKKDPFQWLEEEAEAEGLIIKEGTYIFEPETCRTMAKQASRRLLAEPVIVEARGAVGRDHQVASDDDANPATQLDPLQRDSPDLDITPRATPKISAPKMQQPESALFISLGLQTVPPEPSSLSSQRVYVDNWESAWDGCGLSRYPHHRVQPSVPLPYNDTLGASITDADRAPKPSSTTKPRPPRNGSGPMVPQQDNAVAPHRNRAHTTDNNLPEPSRRFLVDVTGDGPGPVLSKTVRLGPLHPALKSLTSSRSRATSNPEDSTRGMSKEMHAEVPVTQFASLGHSDWRPPTVWGMPNWQPSEELLSPSHSSSGPSLTELSPAGSYGSLPELSPVVGPCSFDEDVVEADEVDPLATPRPGDFAQSRSTTRYTSISGQGVMSASSSSGAGRAPVSPDLSRGKHNFSRPIRHIVTQESRHVGQGIQGLGIMTLVSTPPPRPLPPIPASKLEITAEGNSEKSDDWKAGLPWFQSSSSVEPSASLTENTAALSPISLEKIPSFVTDTSLSGPSMRFGSQGDAPSSSPSSFGSLFVRAKRRLNKKPGPGSSTVKISPVFSKPLFSKSFPELVAGLKPPPKITPGLIERPFQAQQERERQEKLRSHQASLERTFAWSQVVSRSTADLASHSKLG